MQQTFADAIALLKADHRAVEALFERFEQTRDPVRKGELAVRICTELKIHTQIEEEIFYPAFRGLIDDDKLDEAYVEHDGAKILVNDIVRSNERDAFFDAKIKVLSEDIKHHVHEEEMRSKGLFAQCRQTTVDLVALGERMLARKQELASEAQSGSLPAARPATLHALAA